MTHRRPAAPSSAPIVGPPARYARRIVTHLQESDLVAAAKRGDRAALDHLLRLHYDRVHGICRRIAGRTRDGDDACQEAMIKIVRNLHRFDERSSFGTWVYRIATNAALDELRKRQRRPALHVADDGASNEPADPASEERIAAVGDRRAIDDALAALPEEFRTAIVLRDVGDLDYSEISEILDVPVGTVKSRIARGRRLLADRLRPARSREPGNRTHHARRPTDPT